MNVMTDQQRQSVTDAALMQVMTETGYWDHQMGANGLSMEDFMLNCFSREMIPTGDGKQESIHSLMPGGDFTVEAACRLYAESNGTNDSLKVLCSAYLQNESFRNTVILDVNESNGAMVTLNAQTNTYTVAFDGTRRSHHEWDYNASEMLDTSYAAQKSAADYYDMMACRFGFNEESNVVVTGHSKGGNKAQYVTMHASGRSMIDSCIALDGQGFSQKALENMQEHSDYDEQRSKITLVCGEDDYVHVLGERLAAADQTYYLRDSHRVAYEGVGAAFEHNHIVSNMFVNSNGYYTCELNSETRQGQFSSLAQRLYREMADNMNPQEFAFSARTIMKLIDGNEAVSKEDLARLVGYVGPVLEDVLFHTPEGKAYLATLPQELLTNESMQGAGAVNAVALWLFSLDANNPAVRLFKGTLGVFGCDFMTADELLQKVLGYTQTGVTTWDKLSEALYTNFRIGSSPYKTTGESIAAANESLKVDTDALFDSATALIGLQNAAADLSKRLQSAYETKRDDQSLLQKSFGHTADALGLDWKNISDAQSHLSKAVQNMSIIERALVNMGSFLEQAENTAVKYGGAGG